MKSFLVLFVLSLGFLVSGLLFPEPAHAYLDPGTGSFILQMLIAGILGAMFTLKTYWHRVKAFFSRVMGRTSQSSE